MVILTVISYKLLCCVICKPSVKRIFLQSSFVKNIRFDFINVLIKKLESLKETDENNL
jgi:hypothetical protein